MNQSVGRASPIQESPEAEVEVETFEDTGPLYSDHDSLVRLIRKAEDPEFERNPAERDQAYLKRFRSRVQRVTDSDQVWNALSEEFKDWYNEATNALRKDPRAALEAPPGFTPRGDVRATLEKRRRGRKAGTPVAKPPAPKKPRASHFFRKLVIENHTEDLPTVKQRFHEQHPEVNVKDGTLGLMYANVQIILAYAKEAGWTPPVSVAHSAHHQAAA